MSSDRQEAASRGKYNLAASIFSFILLCGIAPFFVTWYQVNSGKNSDNLYVKMAMDIDNTKKYGDQILSNILDGSIKDYLDYSLTLLHNNEQLTLPGPRNPLDPPKLKGPYLSTLRQDVGKKK